EPAAGLARRRVSSVACGLGMLCFAVLRHAFPVAGRCLVIGGVASQPERPQPCSLFLRRAQLGLVLGHCLLALTHLLFFLEQSFGATMRFIHIHIQCRNSWLRRSLACRNPKTSSYAARKSLPHTEQTAS